jgi:hypothetical protein
MVRRFRLAGIMAAGMLIGSAAYVAAPLAA